MVEVAIMFVDNSHANGTKDRRGCYKAGDPVQAMPAGSDWGMDIMKAPKDGGKFFILTITDKDLADLIPYTKSRVVRKDLALDDHPDNLMVHTRRQHRIVLADLPSNVRHQIFQTGRYSATWAQVSSFVENKTNGHRG